MTKYQVFLIIVFLFFFGSGGGWVLELFFRRFFSGANPERKWLNPGFLFGPCVPLYGFGTVVLFVLSEFESQIFGQFGGSWWYYLVMFFGMALAMTALEYIAGLMSLKVMHLRLWDYSHCWGNIQGLICPLFTFFWGVLAALYYFLLYPRLRRLVVWFVASRTSSAFIRRPPCLRESVRTWASVLARDSSMRCRTWRKTCRTRSRPISIWSRFVQQPISMRLRCSPLHRSLWQVRLPLCLNS